MRGVWNCDGESDGIDGGLDGVGSYSFAKGAKEWGTRGTGQDCGDWSAYLAGSDFARICAECEYRSQLLPVDRALWNYREAGHVDGARVGRRSGSWRSRAIGGA